ncbi:PadR family transcriptional regulator [Actinomadura darangshiensis]|uniref:PadR family transcriptional regulator n=1 Tax=Actinomadura darangshiensis TaxID=705336 RepID=A0A4R5A8L3_9ACTN|nr:PadR family transcriptional regulator [Actinomadura darangshiensis]TDD68025.1 PadR family transcriptional regulator [Actinomadura darangshiensis]
MSLRHAVLGLIAEMDGASGYDLLKRFEISLGNVWPARQSQLYGELGKLDDAGLIEVAEEGPRGRKAYRITESGRAELHRWMVTVPAKPNRRDEGLLRVFFLGLLEPGEARHYLRGHAEGLGAYLDELSALEKDIEWGDDDLSVYGRLVMEYGKRFAVMRRDWAQWALEEIQALEEHE